MSAGTTGLGGAVFAAVQKLLQDARARRCCSRTIRIVDCGPLASDPTSSATLHDQNSFARFSGSLFSRSNFGLSILVLYVVTIAVVVSAVHRSVLLGHTQLLARVVTAVHAIVRFYLLVIGVRLFFSASSLILVILLLP